MLHAAVPASLLLALTAGPPSEPGLDAAVIARHVAALTGPEMAGRRAGTRGGRLAADYLETSLRSLGLGPLFRDAEAPLAAGTYRQPIERAGRSTLGWQAVTLHLPGGDVELDAAVDFRVFQSAGGGVIERAPVTFVGYSIPAGERGYLGYPPRFNLDGAVALAMRFEPMDDLARSRWAEQGWTVATGTAGKVSAAARRGAGAVALFTPPGAEHAQDDLEEVAALELAEPIADVPALVLPLEHARAIIEAGDPEGRTLEGLKAQADRDAVIVPLEGVWMSVAVEVLRESAPAENIGAILPGRGDLADEVVVLGAHYDGVGLGRDRSRVPERMGEIHPGADDNASGVAGVLAAAADLARRYDALKPGDDARGVAFVLFTLGCEDRKGSAEYLDVPAADLRRITAMINLDTIGGFAENGLLEIGGRESSAALRDAVLELAGRSGFSVVETPTVETDDSDHRRFDERGVPNLLLSTGLTTRYLTPDDTPETIDTRGAARVARLAADIAWHAATTRDDIAYDGPGAPAADDDASGERRVRVRVGLIPAADTGMDDGVRVARVQEGTGAAEGGLRPGDRLVRWGDAPIRTIADFQGRLLDHEPGDRVRVTVIRRGAEVTTTITLDALRRE